MFKKSIALGVALMLGATTLVGCGGAKTPAQQGGDNNTPQDTNEKAAKIAMVTDVGGVNDQSFNQSAWEGIQRAAKDFGFTGNYRESHQDADFAPNLDALVEAENELIFGIGYKMGDAIEEAANNYPDQKFAIIDNAYENTPENVVGVIFKDNESSYLVGVIAAKMTKTNKVGFIGGIEGDVINRFKFGFMSGVRDTNPDVEVLHQFANSFTDSAIGKSIALQMYQQGADIIFHAAGGVGEGLIEAAKEQNKFAIGVDRDQSYLAPDNVITSAMKRVDEAVYNISKDYKDGKYAGGETVVYGLAEDGVGIAPTSDKHVPKEVLDFVEEQKQKIIKGEIKVPGTEEEFNAK